MLDNFVKDLKLECVKRLYDYLKDKYIVCICEQVDKKALIKINCTFENFYYSCCALTPNLEDIFVDNMSIVALKSENLDTAEPDTFLYSCCEIFDDEETARLYYEVE